jgi:two-component system phosphate regulon sensor histidine kinase PhoR
MAKYNNTILPKSGLIQRRSSNYYAVNINSSIDAGVLEQYLLQEMTKQSLSLDFEYAVFDCISEELVYGNYCSTESLKTSQVKKPQKLPKFNDLVYYFVVRFPSRESFLLANKTMALSLSILSALAIGFFLYSIWVIMEQKRLSELQKDFINNMTHEFKTPISSIKIASDFLSNDVYLNNDPKLKKYIQIIRDQNQRLNAQVEKVLNIARLEKDSIELKKEIFELNQTLSDIIHNESLKLSSGNISFLPLREVIYINADKLHFVNVIANLIDNAIKYSEDQALVDISITSLSKDVLLNIKDNGIGIDKEQQKKLFDKFYRVSTGNIHNVKGFGLGLYYVKNICDAHGWNIHVESTIGQGSTFIITIPKFNQHA